jgi:uncharacterized protein (DUF362 family)
MGHVWILNANENDAADKLHQFIKSVGLPHDLHSVIIKPNVCCVNCSAAAVSDMRIVEGLLRAIHEASHESKVYIVESDNNSRRAMDAFRKHGYTKLAERYGVQVVNLSKMKTIRVKSPVLKYFREVPVPEIFWNADYFISVGKLKTHNERKFTCILKNQFGCLPTQRKARYHPFLADVISDLNAVLKPDLCVVDAIIGMEGYGPQWGTPRRMNMLIVGDDPVLTDTIAARMIGLNPNRVPYILRSQEKGVGEMSGMVHTEGAVIPQFNFKRVSAIAALSYRTADSIDRTVHSISSEINTLTEIIRSMGSIWHVQHSMYGRRAIFRLLKYTFINPGILRWIRRQHH